MKLYTSLQAYSTLGRQLSYFASDSSLPLLEAFAKLSFVDFQKVQLVCKLYSMTLGQFLLVLGTLSKTQIFQIIEIAWESHWNNLSLKIMQAESFTWLCQTWSKHFTEQQQQQQNTIIANTLTPRLKHSWPSRMHAVVRTSLSVTLILHLNIS